MRHKLPFFIFVTRSRAVIIQCTETEAVSDVPHVQTLPEKKRHACMAIAILCLSKRLRISCSTDFRRDNRPEMRKAGNLRHAFSRTSGEAYAILDADFCPRPDFLREMVPYLLDPSIGIVQSPQYFRWREEQTWTERGAGASQEFFYRLEQVSGKRTREGASCQKG